MNFKLNLLRTVCLLLALFLLHSNCFASEEKTTTPNLTTTWYIDNDGDGFGDPAHSVIAATQPVGYVDNDRDCADDNPVINPDQPEICNGIDDNCDGNVDEGVMLTWYKDLDNDLYSDGDSKVQCTEPPGYKLAADLHSMAVDCDDENAIVNPGATEVCNDRDDNCDGNTDEGVMITWYPDFDNDGYSTGTGVEQCTRPAGHKLPSELNSTGGDCDDLDSDVNISKTEVCNGKDDNCDTQVDEGVMITWYPDLDNDGYSTGAGIDQCIRPGGHKMASELTSINGDCDDNDVDVNAGATEVCNNKDDDCDTQIDEGVMITWYPDLDNDGYSTGTGIDQCIRPGGHKMASELTSISGDCDDNDVDVNAGATEVCNNKDDDCDTQIDEGVMITWYPDLDNDGYSTGAGIDQCIRPGGHKMASELTSISGDCDDNDVDVNAGATEACNGKDDDCDGQIDENGVIPEWFADIDGDGYSDGSTIEQCQRPGGHKLASELVSTTGDCDDTNPSINAGATEVCNNIDDNCNAQTDEGLFQTWYKDLDNDDYGDDTFVSACSRPSGHKLLNELSGFGDCDDDNPAINPGEPEVCNAIDDNCNSQINEGITQTWYKDLDDDDYGDGTFVTDCQQPGGYKLAGALAGFNDCDDDNPAINPGTPEVCNNIDDNCNGQVNEGLIRTWYKDNDNDGYSDGQNVTQCNQLGGFKLAQDLIQIDGDCNDENPGIHPNATEICDGLDNNCNGTADNSDPTLVDNESPVASCRSIEVELDINGEIVVAVEDVFDQPGSFDNCGAVNPISLSKSLYTCADIGINHPTLFVNDGHGNNAQCTGIIRVKDTMKPAVTCKTAVVSLNYFGEAEAHPSVVFESGYDNCVNFYLSVEPNQFDCSHLGPNFVTLYSEDDHENVNFCHSTITIIDDIAPDIYCKPHTVYLDENGQGSMVPSDVYLNSYDNCGTVNLVSVLPNTFDCGDLTNLGADNIVELTVNDGNGNSSSCTANVTVVDAISPIPVCQPITHTLNETGLFTIPPADLFAGGWDNCNVLNPQSVSPLSLDCDQVGVNPVTLTVNDGNGNTGTCETTVTILAGPYFTWYKDFDGDDWSDGTPVIEQCDQPIGYDLAMNLISLTGDCNDLDPFVNPDRAELCNGVDDDCDNTIDEVLVTNIIVANQSACDDNGTSNPADDTFTADVTIEFEDIPSVGTLNLTGDGEAAISVTGLSGGSHTFSGVEMPSDGSGISLTAFFAVAANCSFTNGNLGFAPASCSPCDLLTIGVSNMGSCNPNGNSDPSDDTFTADVTVTFFNPPTSGTLDLTGDGSASVNVAALNSNNSHTFSGVVMDADGTPIALTADFSANGNCSLSSTNSGFAMSSCCNVEIAAINVTPESCEGAGDGSIEIIADGTGTLQYSIDGGANFSMGNVFTNLLPGNMEVIVQVQAQGCTDAETTNVGTSGTLQIWYKDFDGDGYTDGTTIQSCTQPTGYVASANPGDCDDADALQHPGQVWYEDLDGDSYGTGEPLVACGRPAGCFAADELAAISGDCDDADANIHPAAAEICNGLDDDCDGQIDEGASGGMTWQGNVALHSQAAVDEWLSCYTVINGNLTIQNTNVNNLASLANLTEVTGNVYIRSTNLTDLAGLESMTTVGGYLRFQSNHQLTTLSGIDGIISVGSYLKVYSNNDLTECCAIYDLITNGGVGGAITINRNETGCDNQSQVENSCAGGNNLIVSGNDNSAPIELNSIEGSLENENADDIETVIFFEEKNNDEFNPANVLTVSPNPTKGMVTIAFGELPSAGTLRLMDFSGRILSEQNLHEGQQSVNMNLSEYGTGLFLLVLNVDGVETQTQRIIVE